MVFSLFSRKVESLYPHALYELTLDLFAVVQYWQPTTSGPTRGRMFETVLGRYCDYAKLYMSERPGSRTIRGARSASGFMHENDTVLGLADLTVHFELKHLTDEVGKNDLLIFNQKGIDYLVSESFIFRRVPLYRIFLSGNILSRQAKRFAVQWGILVIEPDRLPLLLLHYLAGRSINNLRYVSLSVQDEVWEEMTALIVPLQSRINRAARVIQTGEPLLTEGRIDRALDYLQREVGDYYWNALDDLDGHWLEGRFQSVARATGLDACKAVSKSTRTTRLARRGPVRADLSLDRRAHSVRA